MTQLTQLAFIQSKFFAKIYAISNLHILSNTKVDVKCDIFQCLERKRNKEFQVEKNCGVEMFREKM